MAICCWWSIALPYAYTILWLWIKRSQNINSQYYSSSYSLFNSKCDAFVIRRALVTQTGESHQSPFTNQHEFNATDEYCCGCALALPIPMHVKCNMMHQQYGRMKNAHETHPYWLQCLAAVLYTSRMDVKCEYNINFIALVFSRCGVATHCDSSAPLILDVLTIIHFIRID